jgi:glucose/arabinose dehydrogenase
VRRAALAAALLLAVLTPAAPAAPVGEPRVIASELAVPWDVLPLPDGRTLIPERSLTHIRVIEPDGRLRTTPAWTATGAIKVLGIDAHPGYASNRWIYAYVTYPNPRGSQVLRLFDDGTNLSLDRVIFAGPIPTDRSHDGGRIRFGPDGKLYVTTGDIHNPALPRDLSSLNGKILRLNDDGSMPPDNPFRNRSDSGRFVYSYGHRHPQGIAWDATGRMWQSEHGPSGESYAPEGARTGADEINLIVPGGD